jgi:hypothetical protein
VGREFRGGPSRRYHNLSRSGVASTSASANILASNSRYRTVADEKTCPPRRATSFSLSSASLRNSRLANLRSLTRGYAQPLPSFDGVPAEPQYYAELDYVDVHAPTRSSLISTMKAAEEEWLQEETADSVDDGEPLDLKAVEEVMSERYDWRKVARRRKATEELQAGSDAELRRPRAPKRYRPTAVAVAPGQPFFQEIESYRKQCAESYHPSYPFFWLTFRNELSFEPLLLQEQQEEESVLEERKQWPIEKLKEEGYCLTDLYAFWLDATQFGRPVAEFSLGPGVSLGWHRFE